MKISHKWLKNYINTSLSPEEISIILTDIGLEVESLERVESIPGGLEGLVIGEVLTKEQHPDADKLSVTTVDYGQGVVQIVCGAPNVAQGQRVVVAPVGATLYPTQGDTFKIKKSKIRGLESLGMICAEDEIGLGTDHDGIIVLGDDAKVGTPAREYYKIEDDYIYEIGLTPNRVDAASHYGVARDLAAYLASKGSEYSLNLPSIDGFATDNNTTPVTIEVADVAGAPKYMGVSISGVTVAPSPEWLQRDLRAIGIAPKNNLVDITNYVLHEIGQPLHAFDADKIEGSKVVVRRAQEGEKFVTLDEVERTLSSEDLMICSAQKPMCIGGVFGGLESGVSETTTNIFLESAYFNPVSIRKSAKRHGLSTDSSFRFERGVDPNITEYALKRAALLFKELAGGEISAIVSENNYNEQPAVVEFNFDWAERFIGKKIGSDKMVAIMESLEMVILERTESMTKVQVPAYRVDVTRDVDIVEDILRIYGFNNIEIPENVFSTISHVQKPDRDKVQSEISSLLSSNSYREAMSNSLTKGAYYEQLSSYPVTKSVKIINPLSGDLNVMRQTLLFNLLEATELNTNRKNADLKLYEFGNCYYYDVNKKEEGGLAPYRQEAHLALLVTGLAQKPSWNEQAVKSDLFTLKKAAEKILRRFGINPNSAICSPLDKKDIYSEAVSFKVQGKELFEMGIIAKPIRNIFSIKADVYYMELNFDTLMTIVKNQKVAARELSKFPEVKRDLALVVDKSVEFKKLYDIAFKSEKKLLKSVSLFDLYEGDKIEEGKKSYALSFILEDTERTLTDNIIEKTMANILSQIERQTGAKVRS